MTTGDRVPSARNLGRAGALALAGWLLVGCGRPATVDPPVPPPVVAAGELMFYGRGAGGMPTASAVLGDIIDAAHNRAQGTHRPVPTGPRATISPVDDLTSAYYVSAEVDDAPGVLATVAAVFGDHGISIRSMEQENHGAVDGAPATARLAFVTHDAQERNLQATLGVETPRHRRRDKQPAPGDRR
jgi:hypothetical protein